ARADYGGTFLQVLPMPAWQMVGVGKPPEGGLPVKSLHRQNLRQQKSPTVVAYVQTKPFSQWWSVALPVGPVSPSLQSSSDEQSAVQSAVVSVAPEAGGSMQMRDGHS